MIDFHDTGVAAYFRRAATPPPFDGTALGHAVADNHSNNIQLWAEEDLARRMHVPDVEIAANKRAIDRFNQARNDAVERIDDALETLVRDPNDAGARLNSETPGSMIDRLSIASLKIYHMALQTQREDVDSTHRERCRERLARLHLQRRDLATCLDDLLAECRAGRARFRTYRQFKMYNDPALNMALVLEGRQIRSSLSTGLGT